MTNAFKREWLLHYYRMGARLARTGGWSVDQAAAHADVIGLGTLERAQVIQGCADEHRCNPTGTPGLPLGAPEHCENYARS